MGSLKDNIMKKPGLYAIFAMGRLLKGNQIFDELYLKLLYRYKMRKKLNLNDPRTMDEKLQWLKLHDKNLLYTRLVDKYECRSYIEEKIGKSYLVPLLGCWENFDEIDFSSLPERFVLKCTHDSGGLVICRNKNSLNIVQARKKINRSLRRNYYINMREWPYKDVKPRIIAEEYISDAPDSDSLTDYKFYCFSGVVDSVMLCVGRETGKPKFYFFDSEWKLKRYNKLGLAAPKDFTLEKPQAMDEMFQIAKVLCEGIPFVRIDLYYACGKIYFGEFTFYPSSGFEPNRLPETDIHFGDLIKL